VSRTTPGLPAKFTGGYLETWFNQRIQDVPAEYNLLFSSFATIDSTGKAVYSHGYAQSAADFTAGVAARKAAGKPVVLSIGGMGGSKAPLTPGAQSEAFLTSVQGIIDTYGFSGIDWDLEDDLPNGQHISVPGIVDISKRLKARYGPSFIISMAPYGGQNGGTDATYLEIAKQTRDILTFVGYQNYNMSTVPTSASVRATMERWMTTAGLRPDQYSLGFLHRDDWLGLITPHSTMVSIYNDINTRYPSVRGVWTWGVFEKDQPTGYPFAKSMSAMTVR
jgi:hypothetical protein